VAEIRRRARRLPPNVVLGDLLLDQRVVAGIGNIYRCEALFLEGHNPWAAQSSLSDDDLDRLVTTASRLMKASVTGLRGPNAMTGLRGPNAMTGLRGPNAVTGLRGPNAMTAQTPVGGGQPLTAGRFEPRLLERYVYRRNGRPCRRCGTLIRAKRHGELARTAYWCPSCQA
jgi:endonuclease-8